MTTQRQLKLLKYLYKKPRSVYWIKKRFKITSLREIASGIYPLLCTEDTEGDSCIVSLSREGIIEVENHIWFNGKFVILQIILPIVIAIITTLITIFLSKPQFQAPQNYQQSHISQKQ